MSGRCHRCAAEILNRRIGVRDACERCQAYIHCCRNCELYEPGMHNDCREPSAEPVADKEQGNFCDFFRLGAVSAKSAVDRDEARAKLEQLFPRK
jgi:hypothetical protein